MITNALRGLNCYCVKGRRRLQPFTLVLLILLRQIGDIRNMCDIGDNIRGIFFVPETFSGPVRTDLFRQNLFCKTGSNNFDPREVGISQRQRSRFTPSRPGFNSQRSQVFFWNFLMLLRFNDNALLREWTVQSLIVVQTHLVLVSGKLVLRKIDPLSTLL